MPSSLTLLLACFMTLQQPQSPSSKAPKPPTTTCGTCRSHPYPSLTTLRLFCSHFRNCLTLDSWPTGTERSVSPPSPPFLMPSHPILYETFLALLPLWSANILPYLSLRLLVTLKLSVKAVPLLSVSPRRDRIRSLLLDDVDDHDAEREDEPSFPLSIPSPSARRSVRLALPTSDYSRVSTVHRSEWTAADLTGRFPMYGLRLNKIWVWVWVWLKARARVRVGVRVSIRVRVRFRVWGVGFGFGFGFGFPSFNGDGHILITVHLGYIHYLPLQSRTAASYVSAFRKIFAFFQSKSFPVTHLNLDNESLTALVTYLQSTLEAHQFVPPINTAPTAPNVPSARVRITSYLCCRPLTFLSPPIVGLPLTELTLNHMRRFALDPSISAWHGIQGQAMDFAAHPIHPAGQLVVSHDPPKQRASWAKHGTRGFYLCPALSHYRSHVVFIPSTLATRITNQLDFFPDPLFTFEDPTVSTPPPDPTSSRPAPTLDGSDLIGQSFVDPDLGLCRVTGVGQPTFLQLHTGNLAPGLRLSPGWHPTLSYTTLTGTVEHCTVTEVARWVQDHPPPTLLRSYLTCPQFCRLSCPQFCRLPCPQFCRLPCPQFCRLPLLSGLSQRDGDHPRTCQPLV
jgi:hypothetical protein